LLQAAQPITKAVTTEQWHQRRHLFLLCHSHGIREPMARFW